MRSKALAVLVAAAIVGCGGGNDSDETEQSAQQPPEQAEQNSTEPTKLEGPRTKANVVKTLGYTKEADGYTTGPCKATDIAYNKKSVAVLEKTAPNPNGLVKNESGTAGVLFDKVTYFCAIQAGNRLKRIP